MGKLTEIRPRKHIPNLLSLSRIALGVVFYLLFRRATTIGTAICLGIIMIGMFTDYLDGTLARRNKLVTLAGKWIDPLSDFAFFFFVYLSFYAASLMPLILLILFLLREVSMYTVVRPLYIKKRMDPAAKMPGKVKTVFQNIGSMIISLFALFYHLQIVGFPTLRAVSMSLLSVMVAVSLTSMYWYVRPLVIREKDHSENKEAKRQALKLVLLTVLPLLVLHCLYAYAVTVLYDIRTQSYVLYVLLNCIFHGLIIPAGLLVAKEFRLEDTGKTLKRVNLPLLLSFIRFTAVPTLVFLFLSIEAIDPRIVLVPFLAFIFLTDLLDGLLARTFGQTTRIGRILDAAGDYLLIFAISWAYLFIEFIPIWLFLIVIVRLIIQAAGIITLYFLRGYSCLKLSFLGKVSVFSVFALYGIELLEYLGVPGLGDPTVVTILEIITAGIVVVSLLEKTVILRKSYGRAFEQGRKPGNQ
jgi:CDP-diacylglycerol--glycerol-3-phosphate 3-phosphatidyltransferase